MTTGILLLPKNAPDAAAQRLEVSGFIASIWPGTGLETSNDAWVNLLYMTGGKFDAFIREVSFGRTSDQSWRYAFAVVSSVRIGKASADIVAKMLDSRKPVYWYNNGVLLAVSYMRKTPDGGWQDGFAVYGPDIPLPQPVGAAGV
jgi:hypothetical protein